MIDASAAVRRRRGLLATLVLAGVLAVFFAPAVLTSRQFLYRDTGRMHAPQKRYLAERLASGQLPEWNPYHGLGAPVIAGAVDAMQHPFNLLFLALPFQLGFKLWALLSYLVAATGGWLWARALGRSFRASLAAGLAFALSGFLVSSSDNLTFLTSLASLPWVLASAHLWVERGGPGRLALLGIASAFCAAAGDPQCWGFAVLLLPAQAALFADRGGRALALKRGLLASAAALLAAAPFVLPVVAWLPHSSRSMELTRREWGWNLLPWRLAELAVPHLLRYPQGAFDSPLYRAYARDPNGFIPWVQSIYAGVTVVALAVLGALQSRRARLLLLGALFFGWTAMGHRAGFGQLAGHLPVLGAFRYWEKMAVWPALLLAPAAAYGIDALADRDGAARLAGRVAAGFALVLLSLLGLLHLFPATAMALLSPGPGDAEPARLLAENLSDGLLHAAALSLVLALLAAGTRGRSPRTVNLALLVVLVDLFAANVRSYVLSPPGLISSPSRFGDFLASRPGLQRVATPFAVAAPSWPGLTQHEAVWLWGQQTLDPCFNLAYGVGSFEGYAGMVPARFTQVVRRMGDRIFPAATLWNFGWLVVPGGASNAVRAGLPPPFDVALAEPSLPAYLLRVPHRPRSYLAGRLVGADAGAALDAVLALDAAPSGPTVVEAQVPAGYAPPRGEARIVRDSPEHVEVGTVSDGRALLVLNDAYAPGWTATVDGRPAEILPANHLARGVWVDAGTHTVSFRYRTPGLREGWAIFALGGLTLAGWGWRRRAGARA